MAFREIRPSQNLENLFEDPAPIPVPREATKLRKRLYTPAALPSLSIEETEYAPVNNPEAVFKTNYKQPKLPFVLPSFKGFKLPAVPAISTSISFLFIAKVLMAVILIWFGAETSGTFYGPASGKFAGIFAVIFYQYQLGTMLEFCGIWLGLDTIKSLFK